MWFAGNPTTASRWRSQMNRKEPKEVEPVNDVIKRVVEVCRDQLHLCPRHLEPAYRDDQTVRLHLARCDACRIVVRVLEDSEKGLKGSDEGRMPVGMLSIALASVLAKGLPRQDTSFDPFGSELCPACTIEEFRALPAAERERGE